VNVDRLRSALADVLAALLGGPVEVAQLRVLTGGASRGTWAFTARAGDNQRRLILRTGLPDDVHAGMELEARAQLLAAAQGAPVPNVLIADDSPVAVGVPFLICDEIEGETIPRRIFRALEGSAGESGSGGESRRARLLRACAEALAAIHRVQTPGLGLREHDQLALWRHRLDEIGDTTATFEWTLRWLSANRPRPSPPRMVHGDFRMGNLIIRDGQLAAVLDWELVHIGEIYEDLAWFCIRAWRFGAATGRGAGGLGSIESFLSAYESASGTTVDRVAMRWWLIRATLSWGIICRYQAERHLSGQTRSVELAAIGRRVCETEWDLLDLLEASARAGVPA